MPRDGGRFWLVPLALLVTGLLAVLATWVSADGIESDLRSRARSALGSAGLPSDGVSFNGRDAIVQNVPPEQADAARYVVRGVDGVRSVDVRDLPGRATRLQHEIDEALARDLLDEHGVGKDRSRVGGYGDTRPDDRDSGDGGDGGDNADEGVNGDGVDGAGGGNGGNDGNEAVSPDRRVEIRVL